MELSFQIKKPVDVVFDYLTDMQKFVSIHPVITKIDKTGNDCYLVHETLTFGFIPFSFTYPVTIESNTVNHSITIRATVMKLTKIEMTFLLTQNNDLK